MSTCYETISYGKQEQQPVESIRLADVEMFGGPDPGARRWSEHNRGIYSAFQLSPPPLRFYFIPRRRYCVSPKSWPILYSNLRNEKDQVLLGI